MYSPGCPPNRIVIITSIVVAATAGAISNKFDQFSSTGGIIGTSVSAAFLLVLGLVNIYILYKLVEQLRRILSRAPDSELDAFSFDGAGCLFSIFKGMFKLIDTPWKMYPLGVLFGLGFDTSSEVALLGISSIEATKGTNIWIILCFPILFTAGMCLLDTTDGALMMALYTSTARARDPITVLYFSVVLTGITIIAALAIGFIQLFTLILNTANPHGAFWDGIAAAGDNFDIIGQFPSRPSSSPLEPVADSDRTLHRRSHKRVVCAVWWYQRPLISSMASLRRTASTTG